MVPTDLPDRPRLGSFHALKLADGAAALGRFDTDGWTIYQVACRVDAAEAERLGIRHVRELVECRRVLTGD